MSDDSCIKVGVRIRPQIAREIIDSCRICTTVTPGEPQITLGTDKSFTYDYVFDTHADQKIVYEKCAAPLVRGSLEGYNATILAYGQTGSGKTYTMGSGFDVEIEQEQVGIIPRAIHQLFDGIQTITEEAQLQGRPAPRFTIYAQFLELYNEDVIDLFDATKDYTLAKTKSGIKIHEDAKHSIYLSGVTSKAIHSAEEALQCLRQGALSRTTASTQMNAQSSRSHAIFTLHIEQKKIIKLDQQQQQPDAEPMDTNGICDNQDFETLTAKFHFVDLAGSERMKRTGATGDRAKEGISINCGLLALGNVISALGDKSKKVSHVPYRDSKLTRLLQDSLGGNSRTVMIACISPSDRDFMETLNTLMYANRARNIQNKVVLNQDKSSRTILMLRQEIQQLQMQLLEYKQGKRIVNEDGTETVNDMYVENTMLQTDVANLRIRLKAMQETIDALNAKNTLLLTEKTAGAWIGANGENADKGMTDIIQGYLKEVEELRAKLLESEYLCSQLRKQANRQSLQGVRNRSISNSIMAMHCDNDEGNSIECLLAVAKKDVEKNKAILSRTRSNVDNDDSFPSEDDETESESDSDDRDSDKNSEYSQELAELTSEINVKQKLIDELETAQKRMHSMRQHYEDKLSQLQNTIKQTQQERDTVLASYGSHGNQPNDKFRKIKDEYETKISNLNKELKHLQSAKREHARLLRSQSQYESQLKALKSDVAEMKRTKVKLINKMKEEANKHHEEELKRSREIAQLRKETRRAENLIRSLETKNRAKDVVLKRKQEEVSALRKAARTSKMSNKAAGRPNELAKANMTAASPKIAKHKWQILEKNIADNTFNRQSIISLEQELERLMEKRKTLHSTLQSKTRRLTDLTVNRPRNRAQISDLEEEIDQIRANLDYYNDSIKEVQQNIIEIEDAKVNFETNELIADLGSSEIAYIVEKLYNMIVYHSSQSALKEANRKELEARLQEIEKERAVEQQLIRHMLEVRHSEGEMKTSSEVEHDQVSETESDSSRSNSPLPPPNLLSNNLMNVTYTKPASLPANDSSSKVRRRTAVPEELLFSQATNKPEAMQQEQQFFPVVNNHNVNNNVENILPTNYNITKVPSASSLLSSRGYGKSELKSPQFGRKTYDRQESTSPKIQRRLFGNSNLVGNTGSMDRGLNRTTPPNSPPSYKRFNSREENVFSRLTSSTIQPIDRHNDKGVINQYQGKTTMKSPLICTNVAEGHSRAVLALSATDDVLFSASKDKTVKVWDLHEGIEMATLNGHPNSVTSVQYDEKSWLAYTVSSAYIKVWDMRYNKCVKTLSSSGLVNHNVNTLSSQVPVVESQITEIKLNDDGKLLYAATGDKVKIWDLRKFVVTGRLSGGHQAAVMCMEVGKLSNEEDLVITGSKDHYIKIFEISSQGAGSFTNKATLEPPHYDGVQTLALRDNMLFSGSRDYVIKKWDLDNRELTMSINNAHKDWICGLTLVERQPILVSVCRSGWLKLWYTDTCTQIGEMRAHDSAINAITTNSSHIFTAAHDGEVKIWRVPQAVSSEMTMSTGHLHQLTI